MPTTTVNSSASAQPWPSDAEATDAHRALRTWAGEHRDLAAAARLLGWDQQTKLPLKGAAGRGRSLGMMSVILHERATSPEVNALISAVEDIDPASLEAKGMRRSYDLSTKLPSAHARACAEASSVAYGAWERARSADDFAAFAPHLERVLELARHSAELYGYETEPYDALHDLYEEGSRAADLEIMFGELRDPINELLDAQGEPDTSVLERSWDIGAQEKFGSDVVARMGFDFAAGRLDETVHPFCAGIGAFDVRLTTRYDEHWLSTSLFGTVHEAGHGIYEQAFDRLALPATIADAPGLGMHESQSRGYENFIGRSRPFWEYWYPALCTAFPEATDGVDIDTFVRQINTAQRSFIRVEADELSYNLHLGVRFELERALVNGELSVAELPEAWNAAYERWFGMRPPSDKLGVLQDVHWSSGSFGYFPTYTLGNVYAAQFLEVARRDIPEWDELLRAGDYVPILRWFDANVYQYGSAFTGQELVSRITGGPVDVQPLIRYLRHRFGTA